MMRPCTEGEKGCGSGLGRPSAGSAKACSLIGAGLIAIAGLLFPCMVGAHAGLVKSVPGSRAALNRAPEHIELCFNEEVELKFSSVQLLAPDGQAVPLDALTFGPTGQRCIVAPLSAPVEQTGTYTVKYKVLSQDGHVVEYGYTFKLRPPTGE